MADEGALRAAALHWDAAADALDAITASCTGAARRVQSAARGEAGQAFAAFWARYVDDRGGFLPATAATCRRQAAGLREYADAVAQAREQPPALAERELAAAVSSLVEGTLNDEVFRTVETISPTVTVVPRLAAGLGGWLGDGAGVDSPHARTIRLDRSAAERDRTQPGG
ncbi:MAG: hypothetical protein DLM59_09085 [Pseudonocardiales bacterium]|nr:MAG: hypothetical protein DLM59_09085 [Pseudonocardiales bacterium]